MKLDYSETINILKHGLIGFGLNPQDWILEPNFESGAIIVKHYEDSTFRFSGRASYEKATWLQLSLE